MKLKLTVLAGLLAGLVLQSCGTPAERKDYRIVAYYPSYKASHSVLPEETFRKITHVNFSFALPSADGSLEYANVARSVRNTAEVTRKTGVKVLVSVGGGGGSELQHAFAAAIHEKETRDALVDNLMKMTDELGLDGLDIDYEAWKLKDEQYDLTGPWGNVKGPHSPFEYFSSSIGIFQEMGFPGEGNDGASFSASIRF